MLPLAAIPLIASGLQMAGGAVQAISGGQKRKRLTRPTYAIPEEIRKNLSQAEQQAQYGLGSAQKQVATQGIERGTAAALSSAGSRRSGLAGLGGVVQAQSDAFSNLAQIDEMERQRKQAQLLNARNLMATYKDKAFDVNQMDPYQQKLAESQALTGAGLQNIAGGLNTAAMTGMYGSGGGGNTRSDVSEDNNVDASATNYNEAMKMKGWYAGLSPEQKRLLGTSIYQK